VRATVDYWDDQSDVYRIRLFPGQRLFVAVKGPPGTRVYLWRPGTRGVDELAVLASRRRVAQSSQRGTSQRFSYNVPAGRGGFYFVHVKLEAEGAGPYNLSFGKSKP
jgi:hypothetical protein